MSWQLDITNIAGIRRGSAEIHEGTNAVRASNWKGKSSLLAAIRTAMGCETSLTEGEDGGRVELTTDDGTHEVTLERRGDTVVRSGTPYIDDEYDRTCASLFAFLDGESEVRQAVRSGENLESVLTRPLDLEEIDQQIADRRTERDRIDRELEQARERANRLSSVQQKVTSLEQNIRELRDRKREITAGETDERTERRDELSDLRAERERVRNLIERLENSVDRTEKKLEDCYEELADLDVPEDPDIESTIAEEKTALEEKQQERELVQSMYSVTERFLEEEKLDLLGEVEHGLLSDNLECWICGNTATEETVKDRLGAMGDQVVELRGAVEERQERIEELQNRRDELRKKRRQRNDLESEITTLESTLADRESELSSARDRLDTLNEQIDDLEATISEVNDEVTDVQSEIKYAEIELDEAREELEACERAAGQVDHLEDQREEIAAEIADLRDRKERLRTQLRKEFDAAIDEVVDRFDTSFEAARLTGTFDLVIARDGREVSRNALSEGELELLGIVTALAGFETYDVTDRTPTILLDELGALDDSNLSRLVDYLSDRSCFLVATAYPENTTFEDHEISPTEWEVVPPASARSSA